MVFSEDCHSTGPLSPPRHCACRKYRYKGVVSDFCVSPFQEIFKFDKFLKSRNICQNFKDHQGLKAIYTVVDDLKIKLIRPPKPGAISWNPLANTDLVVSTIKKDLSCVFC